MSTKDGEAPRPLRFLERAALALVLTSFFCFPLFLLSRPNGTVIPLARTGGPFPGESVCATAGCHVGTPNSGPGSVSIEIAGAPINQYLYKPGETVDVTVRVADPDQQRWGFQITARDADEGCMSVGSFGASADAIVRTAGADGSCGDGREFATHGFAKAGGASGEFGFTWTAPADDVGPIIFAAAGNAANGDNFPSGDRIYTTSQTVQPTQVPSGPDPVIGAGGVILANLLPTVNTVSPLSIVSVFGTDFSTQTIVFPNLNGEGRLETILGGACVEVGGERSPIFAITPTQANIQIPATTGLGPVGVTVIRDCDTADAATSNVEMVTVEAATPGFFIFDPVAGDGFIAARFNTGFAPVAPEGVFADAGFGPSRPAIPGEIILLFGTGWGETELALETGELAGGAGQVLPEAAVMVTFGGVPLDPADVLYVGVTPQTGGLFQLALRVPAGADPGHNEVVLTVYGKSTPVGPVIPVGSVGGDLSEN